MSATQSFFDRQMSRTAPMGSVMRALVLDDSEVDRTRIKRVCRQSDLNLEFTQAATIAEFAEKLDSPAFEIVFLDYVLVQGDGLIALEMLKRHPIQKTSAAIMVAGEAQIQIAIDALKSGCSDYIIKDKLGPDMMYRAVMNAMEKQKLRQALGSEEDARNQMQRNLERFSMSCGSEMRSILSGMLRRTRSMRRQSAGGVVFQPDNFADMEDSCQRLWDFLEDFQAFVSEAGERPTPRLN